MSRTTPATCRSSEPPPPTTVALDPVVTPSDCAAPRSTRTALASAAGHAPPDTARLPTSGGVAGRGAGFLLEPLASPPATAGRVDVGRIIHADLGLITDPAVTPGAARPRVT